MVRGISLFLSITVIYCYRHHSQYYVMIPVHESTVVMFQGNFF